MTAAETWRYGGDDIPYSMYVGGVGEMPNGSRFIASTGVKLYKEGSQCGAKGVRKARLLGDPSDANLGQSVVRTAMTFVRGSDALTSPIDCFHLPGLDQLRQRLIPVDNTDVFRPSVVLANEIAL